ncbi:MAG: YceI family protein [Bacteroidia bacterium]|nr:YceI family protein [Bacteroidia bacterium]
MKNIILSISTIFILTQLSLAQNFELEPTKSQLNWTGKAAFNAYSLSGSLEAEYAQLRLENGSLLSANILIDMKSLEAENKDLQKHLRSKDFFEVKKYPEASFVLTETSPFTAGKQRLKGNLIIKKQSHPAEIQIEITEDQGSYRLTGSMTIDRTQYGIYFNSPNVFTNLKEQAIADEFELEFVLHFKEALTP